ncbi:MAG: ycfQ2 [Mycobacterium sp.]|nr:ycfQ2 [Mycobacterium sp.]
MTPPQSPTTSSPRPAPRRSISPGFRGGAHVLAVADATGRDTEHLGCLLANGTAELAGQNSAVADRARRTFEALEDGLVECIQQAQRHGAIDPAVNARRHGRLLQAVLRGIEALGKANTDNGHCARSPKPCSTPFRAPETANQDDQVVLDPQSLVVGVLQGAEEARTSAQCPRYTPSVAWPSMSEDDERQ